MISGVHHALQVEQVTLFMSGRRLCSVSYDKWPGLMKIKERLMLAAVTDFLWSYILISVLIVMGLIMTIRSRFVQIRYFGDMFQVLGQAFKHQAGHVSSFQALTLSVAGRVGAGNIAGVAVAITLGGPGAVFWMWMVGLIGMATSFFECSLAQAYKTRDMSQGLSGEGRCITLSGD